MKRNILFTVCLLFFIVFSYAQNNTGQISNTLVKYLNENKENSYNDPALDKKVGEGPILTTSSPEVERRSAIVAHTDLHSKKPGQPWSKMTIQEQINLLQQDIDEYHLQNINEPLRLQKLKKAVERKKLEQSLLQTNR